MALIKIELDYPLEDGMSLTFKAPCDCTAVTGVKVYYPDVTEDATTTVSKTFSFRDTHLNALTGIGNLFSSGATVKIVVDTVNSYAFIQNADTNKYLENKMSTHTHPASSVTEGTLGGKVVANATAVEDIATTQLRNIEASTTDLTAGTSALTSGNIYLVYE